MTTNDFTSTQALDVLDHLFSSALPEAPPATEEEVRAQFEMLMEGWGAQVLAEGNTDQIREKVLRNLEFIKRRSDFGGFSVRVRSDAHCAQVNAFMVDGQGNTISFVPVRVWKTEHKLFACGNSDFEESFVISEGRLPDSEA